MNKININRKKIGIIGILIIVTIPLTIWLHAWYGYYKSSTTQSDLSQLRELILLSVQSARKTAPVDHKTGDVYFPEAKLYLKAPQTMHALVYSYVTDNTGNNDGQPELSVSTDPLLNTSAIYASKNQEELSAATAQMQSCSRGIKIVYIKLAKDPMTEADFKYTPVISDDRNELLHTVRLNNGRDAYVYIEKTCASLRPLAEQFTNLQAY